MDFHKPLLEDKSSTRMLALGALGIVFGDIGTSPLYAFQECFAHGLTPDPINVLGVASLIFWGLTIVVSLKYIFIVMRANNRGEGGILAITSLAIGGARRRGSGAKVIAIIGLCGASLFFGDSVITPAISVLSAVEGLNIVTTNLQPFILPITVIILFMLFLLQRVGSAKVGSFFGPVMVLWFFVIALVGARAIVHEPAILQALNPLYAVKLAVNHGWLSFTVLGAVLLAFTGAEALYADMGHFGLAPIRYGWFLIVMPALMISYFGQGALILSNPEAVSNPFYHLVPPEFMLSMVGLATMATVIASQAVITGTFSLIQQAMQLDYLPRFTVRHTSASEYGQIYVPQMNWLMCLGVLLLVFMFRSSSALANAYGFAVVGTMLTTTLLVFSVVRNVWHWPFALAALVLCPFLAFDLIFFATASAKIPEGGWLPLCIGAAIFVIFMTWRQGREVVRTYRKARSRRLETFVATITDDRPLRVSGTAVYLSSLRGMMPQALQSNLRHNKVLHERVIILTIMTEEQPRMPETERATINAMGKGIWQVALHYGFMEFPKVADDLQTFLMANCPINMKETSFFIGHDNFVAGNHPLKPLWRENLFLWLSNHAADAFEYFRIPSEHVVELGVQVEV